MGIIDHVRDEGDRALLKYAEDFDGVHMESVQVDISSIKKAYDLIDRDTLDAIRFAENQIRFFAEKQKECLKDLNIMGNVEGLELGHRMVPVERAGCYVPAGRHPLPSSALMGIVTAKVAGVKEVVACSPAFKGLGTIHPAVLVAMDVAGADEIYCIGGAQAIAAMAYGTESVHKVNLIAGPGNKFVTEAKRQVLGDVGIDLLAGPSEVLVLADQTANPVFVAIDLLAQAEHDPDAKPMFVCTSQNIIDSTLKELERLLETIETKETALQAWQNNGQVYLAEDMEEAIRIVNELAPEHLEVQVEREREVAEKLRNYGSLFVGHYAPVAFGDFVSGTNHTLPTMETAKYSNGVWVGTFIKTGFHQFVSEEGCRNLSVHCMKFAEVEGLFAHRESVRLRVE